MKKLLTIGVFLFLGFISISAQETYPAFDTSATYSFNIFTPQLDSVLESGFHYQNNKQGIRIETVELSTFPALSFADSVSKAIHYPNGGGLDTLFLRSEKNADGSGWHLGFSKRTHYTESGRFQSFDAGIYSPNAPYPRVNQQHEESDSLGNYLYYELTNLTTGPDTVNLTRRARNGNIEISTFKGVNFLTYIFETRSINTNVFNNDGLLISKSFVFRIADELTNTDSTIFQYDNQGREVFSQRFDWSTANGGYWQNSEKTTTTFDISLDTISEAEILTYVGTSWRPYRKIITTRLDLPSGKETVIDTYQWLGSSYYWNRRLTKTYDSRERLIEDYFYADWNNDSTSIGQDYRAFTYFDTTDIIRTEVYWVSDNGAPYQKLTATYNSLDDLGNIGIDNFQLLAFRAFPNPSSDMVAIALPSAAPALIQLMDIHGRVVLQEQSTGTNPTIAVNGLPAGAYVLQLRQGNRQGRTTLMVR